MIERGSFNGRGSNDKGRGLAFVFKSSSSVTYSQQSKGIIK